MHCTMAGATLLACALLSLLEYESTTPEVLLVPGVTALFRLSLSHVLETLQRSLEMQPTGWKSCSRSLKSCCACLGLGEVRKTKADVVLRLMLGFGVWLAATPLAAAVVLGQKLNPQLQALQRPET